MDSRTIEQKLDDIHELIGELRKEVKQLGSRQQWASIMTASVVSAMIAALQRFLFGPPRA